jgi:dihydrodipicolinate synthase
MLFKGTATALITPFANDEIDFESYGKLIDLQLAGGVKALVVNGTTGEPTTMTHKERTDAARFVIERVNKKIPVICGAGSNNTHTAVEYAEEAEELGADGVLVVTPYYNKCTQKGLIAHFSAVADAINVPLIMYNVPGRTGMNINPETAEALAGHKNIAGIKEASGSISQFMELARLVGGKLDIYSGDDGLIYPILALGGLGVISVASNIIPAQIEEICSKFFAGEIKKSLALQLKAANLIKALFTEVNPIPVKCAARILGIIKTTI